MIFQKREWKKIIFSQCTWIKIPCWDIPCWKFSVFRFSMDSKFYLLCRKLRICSKSIHSDHSGVLKIQTSVSRNTWNFLFQENSNKCFFQLRLYYCVPLWLRIHQHIILYVENSERKCQKNSQSILEELCLNIQF